MKLLTLFMIGLLLLSCKKERTIHITAKNAVTGQPYPGLTYYVVQEMTAGDEEKTPHKTSNLIPRKKSRLSIDERLFQISILRIT